MKKPSSTRLLCLAFLAVLPGLQEPAGALHPMVPDEMGLESTLGVAPGGRAVPFSARASGEDLLQFKSKGHVLGFQHNRVFLAGLDHALSVEFLGTPGVKPMSTARATPETGAAEASGVAKSVYRNLWEGIDVTYEAIKDGIAESTYHLAPGADAARIRLRYNVPAELQKDGSLRYKFETGYLTESPPVAWQEIDGTRVPVRVDFRVSENEVGFAVDPYERNQPLIIDPTYEWHTFYGSNNDDYGSDIAVDGSGNVYVTGWSKTSWGSPLHAHSGGSDIFVLKLDASGTYLWHTFYGSASSDAAYGIAVDADGNIHVTGRSDASWGSPLHPQSGGSDVFVLKLDTNGAYQWHTFYGSNSDDEGHGIAVDDTGNVYVTGGSEESWGSPLHAHSGGDPFPFLTGGSDLFVLKLDASGTYQWHTFFGSKWDDVGYGIAVDGSGNVYVTGGSHSWGSPLHACSDSYDIIVLKLNMDGAYQWHTFYGSSYDPFGMGGNIRFSDDKGYDIVLDGSGSLFVVGYSAKSWGSPLHAYSGKFHAITVLKLDTNGAYRWHTFYEIYDVHGMALDGASNVYVTGKSDSWGSPLHANSSYEDIIVLKLDREGAYQWHTCYGSKSDDVGVGIAADGSGNIYLAGRSEATWGSPLNAHADKEDVCVLKLAQPAVGSVDFNGDVRGDILWRHTGGDLYLWQMEGLTAKAVEYIPAVDPSWQVNALGDFNGDGMTDILWRHTDGMLHTWMMNGATAIDAGSPGAVDLSWSVLGAADFGGDGRGDILWRHTDGDLYLWQMEGLTPKAVDHIPPVDPSWQVKALGDFNGDGRADILWRHASGMLYLWLMNGATVIGAGSPGTIDLGWAVFASTDFNGDMKADILWRHTSGETAIWQMDGFTVMKGGMPGAADPAWIIADACDFNGDGRGDILWRHSSGATAIWQMDGFTGIGGGFLNFVDPSWHIENR